MVKSSHTTYDPEVAEEIIPTAERYPLLSFPLPAYKQEKPNNVLASSAIITGLMERRLSSHSEVRLKS